MAKHFDVVVIGSGQSGTPLSMEFAKAGQSTALIESAHLGGCCVNEGCTPTKTMVASGRVAYLARRGRDYGVTTTADVDTGASALTIEMVKVRQRKRDIVASFRSGSERRVKEAGIYLYMGSARFEDERTIRILQAGSEEEKTVTADRVFINTGERPTRLALEGLGDGGRPDIVLDSTSVQELAVVPKHLVVIGGGYIGIEFGQLFRRLGARVTIVHRGEQLLPREDPEIAECLLKILQEDGIDVRLRTVPAKIAFSQGSDKSADAVSLTVNTKDKPPVDLQASHVLLATGRTPNTDALNLSAAGVKTDAKGHIVVDSHLRTTNPQIWALGDVKGGPAFTHVSYDDFRVLRSSLLPQSEYTSPSSTADRVVPYVVYADPQLGHVGLHEHEARKQYPGRRIQTAAMPMAYVARALETDESRGLMKAVVDADSQQILGFTCLGIEGGELMSVVQTAMLGKTKWTTLRDAMYAHPSLAESLNNLWGFLK